MDEPEVIGKDLLKSKRGRDGYTKAETCLMVHTQINGMRRAMGWTQGELAERAGMVKNVISRLERPDDRMPSISTLVRLANAFDARLEIKFIPYATSDYQPH